MSSVFFFFEMKEFQYLDYCTEYSCEGDLVKEMDKEACFGYVFNRIDTGHNVKYRVILYSGTEFSKNEHQSNACLFTKREVRRHLLLLKSLYPFHYKVSDYKADDDVKYNRIEVFLELSDVPPTFHKYILTWLRYTYEYPYNVILKDVYALKKDPTFRFESISNLFNLVIGCFCSNPRDIHQIPRNQVSTPMKLAEVREKIQKVKHLNDIYQKLRAKKDTIPKKIGEYNTRDIEYWRDGFEVRKPIYMKVYKEIKR